MIQRECQHWKGTTEKGRHYDTMLNLSLKYSIHKLLWLPYKSIEEDTNSSIFRALVSGTLKSDPNVHNLLLIEIIIPNEGKVMETNISILNETDSQISNESSVMKKYEMKTIKIINLRYKAIMIGFLPMNNSFLTVRFEEDPRILIFDTNRINEKLDPLVYDRPVLELNGHEFEGYGMDWHPEQESRLLSCDEAGIMYWDIKSATEVNKIQ